MATSGAADQSSSDPKRIPSSGTRVFKKNSPNNKITTYLSKRDFVDHLTRVDPIDGVVLVDPDYIKDRKVFVHVLAAFRYGREDLDVLGLTFRKDLYIACMQVCPPLGEDTRPPTRLQKRLMKKLGENAHPFYFELPPQQSPASVTLQPGANDGGKPCGVDYELKTYVADQADGKTHKRSTVTLAIRKLTYAPEEPGPQPTAEVTKEFRMSAGTLRLEASLDKEKYYHGESIAVNLLVDNNTGKTAKKVRISVRQVADICLFSPNSYKCNVAEIESEEGFPIGPGQTGWCRVFHVCPLLANNRDKRGLALDGQLKHEDTNLASSTIMKDSSQSKENLGIVVNYRVKVRLVLGFGSSDVCLELPFVLTHPKPPDELDEVDDETEEPATATPDAGDAGGSEAPPAEGNLIQLDGQDQPDKTAAKPAGDEDLVFEDFARLRLRSQPDDEA
uniref:Arrestin_C domain-containing protein n=1 Tax=Macrostomum lignano TaxID=282301 RepID=A0A1I8II94_9PLAT